MRIPNYAVLTISFLTFFCNVSYAQLLEGKVVSTENVPIEAVTVFLAKKPVAKTDSQGIFTIKDSINLPVNLRFQHPNYFDATFQLSKNNSTFILYPKVKLEILEEVIISSIYQKESKVIIPTEKITSAKFEAYSPMDLVAAINETPGVYIQSGAINTNRIVIRGVGSRTLYGTNKIRAYFNGIPITNGIGETSIDAFNLEDLQSLEIVKGPKATQYGTNLGGTLLLNSKQVNFGESFFKTNLTVGSFGLIKNSVSTATSNENFSVNLNYDHLQTEGFRENSNYDRQSVLLTATYTFNPRNELSFLMNYVDYFAQIPSSISKTAFEENPAQAAFTWKAAKGYEDNKQTLAGLSFTHRFSENFSNTSSLYYTYLDHYEPRPFNILDEFTNGYGARTVFAKDFSFLKNKANLSFGGEFYKDEYNWQTLENLYEENNGNGSLEGEQLSANFEKRDNLNVFATVTLPFTKKFKGQFGLNFNQTNYDFTDYFNEGINNKSAERNFEPILAPNVNLLYQFTENVSSYFNFSKGFNYPSIEETLTPEGVINPELGPEKGFNYELGSEAFFFRRNLHLQLTAYLLDITGLLVAQRVGDDQYIGRNAGKTEHKGLEISASYTQTFSDSCYVSPYLNAEITDHEFIDFVDGDNDYSSNQLTGVPESKLNAGVILGVKNFLLNTNLLHIREIPLNDSNTLYSNPYTIFNTKVSYKKELSKLLSFELNAGVNNFTDEKYASSILINATGFGGAEPRYYYPGMPRNWYGGFQLKYQL
jgi:iron complex outermembrane receptor protein